MECNSAAAIEGSRLSQKEQDELQGLIRKAVEYIDTKLEKS